MKNFEKHVTKYCVFQMKNDRKKKYIMLELIILLIIIIKNKFKTCKLKNILYLFEYIILKCNDYYELIKIIKENRKFVYNAEISVFI